MEKMKEIIKKFKENIGNIIFYIGLIALVLNIFVYVFIGLIDSIEDSGPYIFYVFEYYYENYSLLAVVSIVGSLTFCSIGLIVDYLKRITKLLEK